MSERCFESESESSDDEEIKSYDSKLELGYGEVTSSEVNERELRAEIAEILNKQIKEKVDKKILTASQGSLLLEILMCNIDAFALHQSCCRLSKLPPLRVRLKEGVEAYKVSYKTMGADAKEAMRLKLQDLLDENPWFSIVNFLKAHHHSPSLFGFAFLQSFLNHESTR